MKKGVIEAMVLCAGEGRRLKPVTDFVPKPLLPVVSRPLLENIIISLKKEGIEKICVNVHHLKEKIIKFLNENDYGVEINISVESKILGTGGGIGKMEEYIEGENFVVYNGDIITNIRLKKVFDFHLEKRAIATLLVQKRSNSRDILLGTDGKIIDIAERIGKEKAEARFLGFTGIAILSRRIFDYLPQNKFYDIVDAYLELIKEEGAIFGYKCTDGYWLDIGTKEKYLQVHRNILGDKKEVLPDFTIPSSPFFIGKGTEVSETAELSGFVSIGRNCFIGDSVRLENCVVLGDTVIDNGKEYENCIILNDCNAC
jgi:NDP-sugar pyrophosphorylase family protein